MHPATRNTFVVLCHGVAAYAVLTYALLPRGKNLHPDMRAVFQAYPLGIYAHVFGSALALALGPFQFAARLRAQARPAPVDGALYMGVGVLLGGTAGLFMAQHTFGGTPARLGFGCLALAWLATGILAFRAIRACNIAAHRRWMVRNCALTFAAVTLRLYLPASMVAGIAFDTAYPVIAWLCWVPNLLVAQWWLNRAGTPAMAPAPR